MLTHPDLGSSPRSAVPVKMVPQLNGNWIEPNIGWPDPHNSSTACPSLA